MRRKEEVKKKEGKKESIKEVTLMKEVEVRDFREMLCLVIHFFPPLSFIAVLNL